jgi:hypothetical protein
MGERYNYIIIPSYQNTEIYVCMHIYIYIRGIYNILHWYYFQFQSWPGHSLCGEHYPNFWLTFVTFRLIIILHLLVLLPNESSCLAPFHPCRVHYDLVSQSHASLWERTTTTHLLLRVRTHSQRSKWVVVLSNTELTYSFPHQHRMQLFICFLSGGGGSTLSQKIRPQNLTISN